MGMDCSTHENRLHAGFLMGSAEKKIPIRRSRRRYEDNIKMDLRAIGWGVMDCIHLAQGMWTSGGLL
jgi:hypothetical protein